VTRLFWLSCVWFFLLCAPALAHAEGTQRLVYSAATGCPATEEFVAAVRARGGDVDPAAVAANEIDVVIERAGDGYRGSVRLQSAEASSAAREVHSARCSEVADGLAIVTALAARTGSVVETTSVNEGAVAAVPPKTADAPHPSEPPKSVQAPRTRLHTVGQFGTATLPVERGELKVRNDTALTLSGGALFGIVPSTVVPRFDFTLSRTNFITTPDGDGHIIGGIVRTRWTVLAPAEYRRSDWTVRMFGFKAAIGGCSQLVYDLQGFVLLACGEIAAGVAKLTTKDPTGRVTKDETPGLASVGLELDARYSLGRLFQVGLSAGGEGWLTKLSAERTDGSQIFHTNPIGGYALLGVGVHFW
jgi:hypothetical protein